MADATIKQVSDFFGGGAKFASEYRHLSASDKAQLKSGIGDGSLTY